MGEQNSLLMSQHNSLVMVVNAAVGGGKGSPPPRAGDPGVRDLAAGHTSAEAAAAAINAALRV